MKAMAREDGVALLVALMALLLMPALGTALILTSSSETIIAAHFRDSLEARYAAGAIVERVNGHVATAVNAVEHLNLLVDQFRQSGGLLQELSPRRSTLEDVFVDLVKATGMNVGAQPQSPEQ